MTPQQAVLAILIPGALTAIVLAVLSLLGRREPESESGSRVQPDGPVRRLVPALVAAAAFFFADLELNQWHDLWPLDGTQRFLAVAVAAAVAGVLHTLVGLAAVTVLVRAALGAAVALAVLTPLDEMYMPRALMVGLVGASGVWLAGIGLTLDRVGERVPGAAGPLVLAVTAAFAAPGLFESGYAGGARLAGGLAAIAGGALVATLLMRRRTPRLAGLHTVWLAVFGAIVLVTYGYQDVPRWWALPIMGLAPLGILGALPVKHPLLRVVVAGLAAAMIAGAATLAVVASASNDTASEYGY